MNLGAMTWTCLLLSAAAGQPDVQPMNQKAFQIPIRFDAQKRAEIRELQLWVSHDKGQTWNEAAQARPDQDHFDYAVTEDGPYWFTMVIIDQKGRADPAERLHGPRRPAHPRGHDAAGHQIDGGAARRRRVSVSWEITEQNPKADTLKLEYAESAEGPWTSAPIKPGPTGRAEIHDPSAVVVRMQMQRHGGQRGPGDQAGSRGQRRPCPGAAAALARPPRRFPPLPTPVAFARAGGSARGAEVDGYSRCVAPAAAGPARPACSAARPAGDAHGIAAAFAAPAHAPGGRVEGHGQSGRRLLAVVRRPPAAAPGDSPGLRRTRRAGARRSASFADRQ